MSEIDSNETCQSLMEKARALMQQAERIRKEARKAVIAEILEKMKAYSITVNDLRPGGKRAVRCAGEPVYRDPTTGKTWTGMGRMPEWLKSAIANGAKIESFRI